jgi:hypothetical protein
MAASVGRRTKLELANEAAVRSAELLGAGDRLGVIHVDTTVRWTVPLAPVTDREKIASGIRSVGVGGGGIYVDVALTAAFEALAKQDVQLKHCLLFSDGADAEERTHAFSIVSRAKADGITTSVVALGNGSDVPDLEQMRMIETLQERKPRRRDCQDRAVKGCFSGGGRRFVRCWWTLARRARERTRPARGRARALGPPRRAGVAPRRGPARGVAGRPT